jgi:ubiquitin carboxyl-terminal hydrolase 5/13
VEKTNEKPEFEPVTLTECLERFTGLESVDLTCAACGSKDGYFKQTRFKTFPETLAVNAQRFELVNWVPTKLDIPVVVGDNPFSLDVYQSKGLTEHEVPLPEETEVKAAFEPNEAALQQLEAMGFPRVRCEKALHATGNSDAETAMNWLFGHMEDPDIDAPVELTAPSGGSGGAAGGSGVSQESIDMVVAMGIDAPKARKALKETNGDIERAVDWVFSHPDDPGDVEDAPAAGNTEAEVPGSSALPATYRLKAIICHKGASVHAGHYVAFVRKTVEGEEASGDQWVLFNDEKVVRAVDVEEMKKFAYVYFFEKI